MIDFFYGGLSVYCPSYSQTPEASSCLRLPNSYNYEVSNNEANKYYSDKLWSEQWREYEDKMSSSGLIHVCSLFW